MRKCFHLILLEFSGIIMPKFFWVEHKFFTRDFRFGLLSERTCFELPFPVAEICFVFTIFLSRVNFLREIFTSAQDLIARSN